MSGNLDFEARVLLHAWNSGIVSRADISAWADQRLAADDFEPDDLSALASLSVPDWPVSDEVRRALGGLAAPDSSTARTALVGVIARLYQADAFPLNEAARILFHLKYEPFGDEYPSEFWSFWDGLDLALEGIYGDPDEVRGQIETVLESYAGYAEWFQPAPQ